MDTFKGGKSIAVRLFYFGVLTNAVKDTSFEEKKKPHAQWQYRDVRKTERIYG